MEATQIMMMPVATDAGMAPVVGSGTEASAGAGTTTNGFGELLAQSMLGTSGEKTLPETDGGAQEEASTAEIVLSSEIDPILASQLAALQMNTPLQQLDLTTLVLSPDEQEDSVGVASYVNGTMLDGAAGKLIPVETGEADVGEAETVLETQQSANHLKLTKEDVVTVDGGRLTIKSGERVVNQEIHQQLSEASAGGISVASAIGEAGGATAQQAASSAKSASEQHESITSKTVSEMPRQKAPVAVKPAATDQDSKELQQAGRSPEAVARAQEAVSKVQIKDGSQPERQVAAESQQLPSELSVGTKNSTTQAFQGVRFAQPTDVVVAASDAAGQNGLSSNTEQQNSPLASKLAKLTVSVAEAVQVGQLVDQVIAPDVTEHHLMHPQMVQRLADSTSEMVLEPLRPVVVPEQIGRQVTERLAAHEIKQGNDQISFKLSPENLGNLQLNMRMEDQRLKLEIVAESREVRNALMQQVDDLKETLARQNIRMDSFDVTTSNNGNLQQQSRDWRQMTPEQRQYQPQYAGRAANASSGFETPVRYFAKQYQSTIDVRF